MGIHLSWEYFVPTKYPSLADILRSVHSVPAYYVPLLVPGPPSLLRVPGNFLALFYNRDWRYL